MTYRYSIPEGVLPVFVPDATWAACYGLDDVTELLRDEQDAWVVVTGIEDLPLRVLDAAGDVRLELLVIIQPGQGPTQELLTKVALLTHPWVGSWTADE